MRGPELGPIVETTNGEVVKLTWYGPDDERRSCWVTTWRSAFATGGTRVGEMRGDEPPPDVLDWLEEELRKRAVDPTGWR